MVTILSSMIVGVVLSGFLLIDGEPPTDVDTAGNDWTTLLLGSVGCLVLALIMLRWFQKKYTEAQEQTEVIRKEMQALKDQRIAELERELREDRIRKENNG